MLCPAQWLTDIKTYDWPLNLRLDLIPFPIASDFGFVSHILSQNLQLGSFAEQFQKQIMLLLPYEFGLKPLSPFR